MTLHYIRVLLFLTQTHHKEYPERSDTETTWYYHFSFNDICCFKTQLSELGKFDFDFEVLFLKMTYPIQNTT